MIEGYGVMIYPNGLSYAGSYKRINVKALAL